MEKCKTPSSISLLLAARPFGQFSLQDEGSSDDNAFALFEPGIHRHPSADLAADLHGARRKCVLFTRDEDKHGCAALDGLHRRFRDGRDRGCMWTGGVDRDDLELYEDA